MTTNPTSADIDLWATCLRDAFGNHPRLREYAAIIARGEARLRAERDAARSECARIHAAICEFDAALIDAGEEAPAYWAVRTLIDEAGFFRDSEREFEAARAAQKQERTMPVIRDETYDEVAAERERFRQALTYIETYFVHGVARQPAGLPEYNFCYVCNAEAPAGEKFTHAEGCVFAVLASRQDGAP